MIFFHEASRTVLFLSFSSSSARSISSASLSDTRSNFSAAFRSSALCTTMSSLSFLVNVPLLLVTDDLPFLEEVEL